jgi:hypothetical protein
MAKRRLMGLSLSSCIACREPRVEATLTFPDLPGDPGPPREAAPIEEPSQGVRHPEPTGEAPVPPTADEVLGLLRVSPIMLETSPPVSVAAHVQAHRRDLGTRPRVTCETTKARSASCNVWTRGGFFYAVSLERGLGTGGSTLVAPWAIAHVEVLSDD